jgi:hypothetical protein
MRDLRCLKRDNDLSLGSEDWEDIEQEVDSLR